jgi:serine protease Do
MPAAVTKLAYAAEAGRALAASNQLRNAVDLSKGFQQVATAVRPSVVSISSVKRFKPTPIPGRPPFGDVPGELSPFFNDDLFNRFFGLPRVPREGFEQHGFGSGVLVTADGYILTNNHVVQGADDVTVRLSDDREFMAEIVGSDVKTDVAVLKIDVKDVVPAQLGNSDDVEVGQWVVAVGSPFGLSETVTAGIISAKGRADVGIADYEDFIQTDAAINPGNSGGPLVNLKGEVIGINTAIASRNGGYMGVGFAIPSNMARDVMESIRKHGHVERGYLGAMIQDLSEDLAHSFGFDSKDGVLVGDVLPGSPAGKAGLKSGDIVLKYNGTAVHSASQLRNAIAATEPTTKRTLEVYRDGRRLTLQVTIGRFDENTATALEQDSAAAEELGISVQTLTPELASRLGYDPTEQGVVVTEVQPNSLAARVGIRPQNLIVAVGKRKVTNVRDFREATADADLSRGVRLQVKADGARRYVFLKSR